MDIDTITNNINPLTASQETVVSTCIKLLPEFKIIVIKGDNGSGKYTAACEIFKRLDAVVESFDLCELAKHTEAELSSQHIVKYLELLLCKLVNRINLKDSEEIICNKKCKITDNEDMNVSERLVDNRFTGIIYFRHYNRVVDVLTDCYAKLRFLLPLVLKTFSDSLPNNIRLLITTHGCALPDGLHWCVDLTTTRNDMEHILRPFFQSGTISYAELQYIMKISKIVPIGRILYCLKYAMAMSERPITHFPLNLETQLNLVQLESDVIGSNNSFIESYTKALGKFSGSTVDIDKDVPQPTPEDDLVGVEEIIDEITTSIINPMRLSVPGIHIKRGLILCGPPGTGKTSIGRWLAHQIKGKFYLIGGEAGINGSSLIDIFQGTIRRARENAPAVVFIDDGDMLFDHDDTYRAFLTILDGIETNKRTDVCVILTCMNMRKVPASLIRGGRLEMSLITRLPDRKRIQVLLERSLNKMSRILNEYDPTLNQTISVHINSGLIESLSHKMCGWNCADIHRCVNDVSRLIISNKGTNVGQLFDSCVRQIREQYKLCGICESTNLDNRPYDVYIS